MIKGNNYKILKKWIKKKIEKIQKKVDKIEEKNLAEFRILNERIDSSEKGSRKDRFSLYWLLTILLLLLSVLPMAFYGKNPELNVFIVIFSLILLVLFSILLFISLFVSIRKASSVGYTRTAMFIYFLSVAGGALFIPVSLNSSMFFFLGNLFLTIAILAITTQKLYICRKTNDLVQRVIIILPIIQAILLRIHPSETGIGKYFDNFSFYSIGFSVLFAAIVIPFRLNRNYKIAQAKYEKVSLNWWNANYQDLRYIVYHGGDNFKNLILNNTWFREILAENEGDLVRELCN